MKKIYAFLFCLCLLQGSYGQSLSYKVAVVYAVPNDVAFNQEVLDSIKVITAEMQGWYQLATGGRTFERLYADTVITYRALQNRQFYVDNGNWWGSLLSELQSNSSVPIWTPGYITVIWAHGAGWWAGGAQGCGQDCGIALVGVELLAKFNNPAYSGGECPTGNGVFSWPCTPQGALFHEFGHALGLPHPVDIPATQEVASHSIMQTHWNYPNWAPPQETPWGLLTIERQTLAQNPFIKANVDLRQIVDEADVVNLPVTGPGPDAAFSYTRTGNQFSFSNQSTGATSYYWTFGDGHVSNALNPVHEFDGPGPYQVTLRASNEEQMMDIASLTTSTEPGQGQRVLSFTLINANTEQPIKVISPGEVLNLATLPTRNLNIRADTDPATVGSVNFALTGPYRRNKWDNVAPYALYGDDGGNYNKWVPLPGTYTLTATPYAGADKQGTAGTPLTLSFSVVDQVTPPGQYTLTLLAPVHGSVSKDPDQASYASGSTVQLRATPATGYVFAGWTGDASGTANPLNVVMNSNKTIGANFTFAPGSGQRVFSFTLINANTEQPIKVISPGEVLNLATLPTRNLNIRADTDPATVGSVNFALTGPYRRNKWDNVAPYALYGDDGGNYNKWVPLPGAYSLTATPYAGADKQGTAGTPLTLSFTVVDQAGAAARLAQAPGADPERQLLLYPNPTADGRIQVQLAGGVTGRVGYTLVSALGSTLAAGSLHLESASRLLDFDFSGQLRASGVYYLRLEGDQVQQVLKILRK